jgi:uncharacterized membrane protein
MFDPTALLDWAEFAVRWLHVITAIAWIGSSFYFIALDLGLRKSPDLPTGAHGEEWQVHGGGFYHVRKYLVAPARMPDHLTWFKWESYSTWLSGAALLMLVYWAGAEIYLIDSNKLELEIWQAIALSAAFIAAGWMLYNTLCKSALASRPTLLMVLLFGILVVMGWGLNQIFTGRAMMLHLGAFTATIMTANVFFIIMPNQRIVVGDLQAGRTPDAKYGKIAKLRSTHNNYLTLPVIFLMLSNHYPLAFASEYNWIIAALVFLMGVTIRHYFNTHHARTGNPIWTIPATIILFLACVWLSMLKPVYEPLDYDTMDDLSGLTQYEQRFAAAQGFGDAVEVVQGNCSMCHAREVFFDGISTAPKGVLLETPADVARNAKGIYLHAGLTTAMPPPNESFIDPQQRGILVAWFQNAR